MAKPITPKQIMCIVRATALDEVAIRAALPTTREASAVISAIVTGDAETVRAALVRAGLDGTGLPADFAARVQAEAARLAQRGQKADDAEPEAKPTPKAKPKAPAAPADGDAEAIRRLIADAVAPLMALNAALVETVNGHAGTLAAMVAEAAAKGGGPSLPPIPEVPGGDYVRPVWFDELYSLTEAGVDVCLVGPAGCGKSRAGREVGAALGRETNLYAFRAGMRRGDLLYKTELRDGETVTTLAPLLLSAQREALDVVDEVFSVDPEILIGLNGLLESGQRGTDTPAGYVTRHPGHRYILTSNTDGRGESRIYRGPQGQDGSTLSRVVVVPVDYDDDAERTIAIATGCPDAPWLVSQAHTVRRACRRHSIPLDVSTRWILQACALTMRGFSKERALGLTVLSRLSGAERGKLGGEYEMPAGAFEALTR